MIDNVLANKILSKEDFKLKMIDTFFNTQSRIEIFDSPSIVDMAKKEHLERVGKNFEYVPLLGDRKPPLDYRKIN